MIDALRLAKLCQEAYAGSPDMIMPCGTASLLTKVDGTGVVIFRGSQTPQDWLEDAAAIPQWDPDLGFVHSGFLAGVRETFEQYQPELTGAVVVTGHSLGGARARIFAGLLAIAGAPAAQVCTFGSPRPAFDNLKRVLEKSKTPLASYRNRNDPVPLVPFGPLYVHTDSWTALDVPSPPDDLDPLRDHHIARYIAGLSPQQGGSNAA